LVYRLSLRSLLRYGEQNSLDLAGPCKGCTYNSGYSYVFWTCRYHSPIANSIWCGALMSTSTDSPMSPGHRPHQEILSRFLSAGTNARSQPDHPWFAWSYRMELWFVFVFFWCSALVISNQVSNVVVAAILIVRSSISMLLVKVWLKHQ
jgi:hypothetical protein